MNESFWHLGTSISPRHLAALTLRVVPRFFCSRWRMWSRSVLERVKQHNKSNNQVSYLKIMSLLLIRHAGSARRLLLFWVAGRFISLLPPWFNDVRAAEIHARVFCFLMFTLSSNATKALNLNVSKYRILPCVWVWCNIIPYNFLSHRGMVLIRRWETKPDRNGTAKTQINSHKQTQTSTQPLQSSIFQKISRLHQIYCAS